MAGTDSTQTKKQSWLVRGDGNSTWFFAGATFAFAGAAFSFSSHGYLLGGLLMAVGAVAIALGIYVWQRGFGDKPGGGAEADRAETAAPTAPAPPPPRI